MVQIRSALDYSNNVSTGRNYQSGPFILFAGGIAQYWLNGRHHAAKHKVSITMKHTVVYTAAILTINFCSVLILRNQSVLLRQESKTISEVSMA